MGISCFRITFADALQYKHVTINSFFFFPGAERIQVSCMRIQTLIMIVWSWFLKN